MGRATSLSLPLRRQCRNHIFETQTEPIPFEVDPGFVVPVKCLVCGDVLPPLEVNSFCRATDADWQVCINEVREEADRLNRLVVTLQDRRYGRRQALRAL